MNRITDTRRTFLAKSGGALAASGLAFPTITIGNPDNRRLKLGLVGCGGRGSGAAGDAMSADSNCELTAVADVFPGSIEGSLNALKGQFKDRVNVPETQKFVGMDAYQKLLATDVDVVLLATPPGFRPLHFKAAVEAGKHIFCEKPVAVDATGVRMVMEQAKIAKEKGLNVLSGFCWRRAASRQEAFKRVLGGEIGDIRHYYATYYTGPVKPMQSLSARKPEWSDVEWMVRNWYNFSWLGGDGLVEQAVHSVDKVGWAMGDKPPVSVWGNGGRAVPFADADPSYNIFDHFSMIYEFPGDVLVTVASRQIPNCDNENADVITGTKGVCTIGRRGGNPFISGENRWRWDNTQKERNMYEAEHAVFYEALRTGQPVNDGEWMCNSTLMAIMGRMACYTGKKVTWEQALNSKEDLAPDDLKWDSAFKEVSPMPKPGVTQLV